MVIIVKNTNENEGTKILSETRAKNLTTCESSDQYGGYFQDSLVVIIVCSLCIQNGVN